MGGAQWHHKNIPHPGQKNTGGAQILKVIGRFGRLHGVAVVLHRLVRKALVG